jgi:hypothetical protein
MRTKALALGLAAVLAVGCSDRPTSPTALNETVPTPSFNFTNGPTNPGPNIVRSQGIYVIGWADFQEGISAWAGIDIAQWCRDGTGFDVSDIQDINVPEDANRISELVHGNDVTTSVWPFTGFDCDLFTTVTPLATGTSDFRSTDNDLNTFLNPDSKNANAFGFNAHGKLTDASGSRVNFSGHSRCVWDGVDFDTIKCKDKINVH